mmetsp:Transcript_34469/g.75228  ORF Transcript_34469/g.75228 Transcript_34469/m.75228 type:complete len:328 (-) Transcript_34469:106-1089(-)
MSGTEGATGWQGCRLTQRLVIRSAAIIGFVCGLLGLIVAARQIQEGWQELVPVNIFIPTVGAYVLLGLALLIAAVGLQFRHRPRVHDACRQVAKISLFCALIAGLASEVLCDAGDNLEIVPPDWHRACAILGAASGMLLLGLLSAQADGQAGRLEGEAAAVADPHLPVDESSFYPRDRLNSNESLSEEALLESTGHMQRWTLDPRRRSDTKATAVPGARGTQWPYRDPAHDFDWSKRRLAAAKPMPNPDSAQYSEASVPLLGDGDMPWERLTSAPSPGYAYPYPRAQAPNFLGAHVEARTAKTGSGLMPPSFGLGHPGGQRFAVRAS